MKNKAVKTSVLVMSILALLLIIAQLAVMCMPYMNLWPIKVRERQDPARDYSMQDFCWLETENMTKIFTQRIAHGSGFDRTFEDGPHYIKDFKVNDFVMDLVLVNVFGILALIFLIFTIKNQIMDYNLGGAGFVKYAAAFCTTLWGGWGVYTFTSSWFLYLAQLAKANAVNDILPVICLVIAIAGLVVGLVNLVLIFVNRTRYKVIKPSAAALDV